MSSIHHGRDWDPGTMSARVRRPEGVVGVVTSTLLTGALAALVAIVSTPGCMVDTALNACQAGHDGCPCSVGQCMNGLTCQANVCIPLGGGTFPGNNGSPGGSTQPGSTGPGGTDLGPNPDAFFAQDPPPMVCLPDGTMAPPPETPGGTPECPDDKNREGCPCTNLGETASCWPGLRVNRERGICQDGVTTCESVREFGRWGPCQGYVLPVAGAASGPESCGCFSAGRWEIDNLTPCIYELGSEGTWMVSTFINSQGEAECPISDTRPPTPKPGTSFSTNRLSVDCEGSFNLCLTFRAGNVATASASDCIVAKVCTGEVWVEARNQVQEMPPLPSWTATDSQCVERFRQTGGYGELSVLGESMECNSVDDGAGGELVFNRFSFCPDFCEYEPDAPGCEECSMSGSGSF